MFYVQVFDLNVIRGILKIGVFDVFWRSDVIHE